MKVRFEDHPGYLVARFSGKYSFHGMLSAIDRIAEEAATRAIKRVLVDVSIIGDAPNIDRFNYAEYAAKVLHGLEKCAAFAGPGQRVEPFTENVAQNRGFKLRVFRASDEAIRWLTDDPNVMAS